jgi:predicted short-subunit dehydrogenase-like oxidoreductase (DUF2520 family)
VVHLSAASGLGVLHPLKASGWGVGLMHPLQTFPELTEPRGVLLVSLWALQGSDADASGDGSVMRLLREVLAGFEILELAKGEELPYHLACVMASNFLPALMGLALAHWPGDAQQGLRALMPLMKQTLLNVEESGLSGSISGPLARGDVDTLKAHANWLQTHAPQDLDLYQRFSAELNKLLLRGGTKSGERP